MVAARRGERSARLGRVGFLALVISMALAIQGCTKSDAYDDDDEWEDDDGPYQEVPPPSGGMAREDFVKSYEQAEGMLKVRRGACQTGAVVLPTDKCRLGGYNTDFCGDPSIGLQTFCYAHLPDRACCCSNYFVYEDKPTGFGKRLAKSKLIAGHCNGEVQKSYMYNFAYVGYLAPRTLYSTSMICPHAGGSCPYRSYSVPSYDAGQQAWPAYQAEVTQQLQLVEQQVAEEQRLYQQNVQFLQEYQEQLRQSQVMIEETRLQYEQQAIQIAQQNEQLRQQMAEFERQYHEQLQTLAQQIHQNEHQASDLGAAYHSQAHGINAQADEYVRRINELQAQMSTNQQAMAGICHECQGRCPVCGQATSW